MPRSERKRLDVRLEQTLYDHLVDTALCDQRSVNGQVHWLLSYALIHWPQQRKKDLDRIKGRAAG